MTGKRTEYVKVYLSKEEKARLVLMAADLHIPMAAVFRLKTLSDVPAFQQAPLRHARPWEFTEETFTVTTKYKRTLPLIPGTPQYHEAIFHQEKREIVCELKIKLSLPNRGLISIDEENLADEVGIK